MPIERLRLRKMRDEEFDGPALPPTGAAPAYVPDPNDDDIPF